MRYTIMAYAADGYQEFILPDIDNADYQLYLDVMRFGLASELTIRMEIVDGVWRFSKTKDYSLHTQEKEEAFDKALQGGDVLRLTLKTREQIVLVVLESETAAEGFRKYSLQDRNQIQIGKAEGNHIVYDFGGYISGNHAVLFRYEGSWILQDNSSNGTYVNGKRVKGQESLRFGAQITLFGLRILYLSECIGICALSGKLKVDEAYLQPYTAPKAQQEEEREEPEKTYFKRAPRTIEKLYTEPVEIEAPPALQNQKKRPLLLTIGPGLTMVLPMLFGCIMTIAGASSRGGSSGAYMFTGIITALTSGVLGVFWSLTNLKYAAREAEEQEELRYHAYGAYLIEITEFIKEKYEENRRILKTTFHSGRECCAFGSTDVRLWNHNERQADFLTVRIGTGTLPFQAEISVPKERFTLCKDDLAEKPAMIRENYRWLHDVPICLDIREKGLLGIVGGYGKRGAYETAKNIIAQIAANNCYTDVKLVFIFDETKKSAVNWSFARWLPHVWMEDKKTRLMAGNKTELGDVCYEMSKVFQARTEESSRKEDPLPHFVIFVDAPELLEGELLERFVYNPSREYGISSVLLAEKYEDLPNSCENIILNDGREARFFHIYNEEEETKDLVPETVDDGALAELAKRLSRVEVHEGPGNGEIPTSLDFMEMYEARTLEDLHVQERWRKNRNYETMRVPIGQKAGGSLCCLDIHEKYHGPHGLVAGTTGSGKSETLQTYILSLAVNFSPDDVAFFIIDFKGGGMANLFEGLPHLAGQISNLSGNQVQRAMISIKSENRRRQRLFAEYGVNNINAYTRMYKNHQTEQPIPHLLIIIDEFAELKREEPEFMKELISVAQVGRSLGVHLILATQKPAGTVDDNIWSNSKFRLCLRVQDRQDSNDMLHKPDAAYITQAGRGYLQVGSDEIYELFQSGYSGAEYDESAAGKAAAAMISLAGREILSGKSRKNPLQAKKKTKSQLEILVSYLREQAAAQHYEQKSALWLPVLPKALCWKDLESTKGGGEEWTLNTVVGLYDDPANQKQEAVCISFSEGGHLAVCGMVSTGKSTFLQTLLYGLMRGYTPEELNFYILDYSSRMLLSFEHAPHTGGVAVDTDVDKVKKLFYMLNQILTERKLLFGGGNYSQYRQAHRGDKKIPAILLVIDNYANFREKTEGAYDEMMTRIAREGVSFGVFLVLTGAGYGASEIPTRLADTMKTVIALEMSDKFKYGEILHTGGIRILPEKDVKGRGLVRIKDRILEFQTALPLEAANAYEMGASLEAFCREYGESWRGSRARRIPQIPEKPTLQEFAASEEYRELAAKKRWLPLGYRSLDASVYAVDLWNTYCCIVQGRARSGKKNVLKLLLHAAAQKPEAVTCVIDLKSKLKAFANAPQVSRYLSDEKEIYEFFKETVPVFKERNQKKQAILHENPDEMRLAETMNALPQYFIFISDLASFIEAAYRQTEGQGSIYAYLENITEKGANHGFYFIAALNPEEHSKLLGYRLYKNMVSYETGIHLGGNTAAQRLFTISGISYQEQSRTEKAGTGLALSAEGGQPERLVLPLARGEGAG